MAKRLRDDFGTYAWEGAPVRWKRTGASGHVAVTSEDVEIRVALSVRLAPLHGRIEREIVTFCDEHFSLRVPDPTRAAPPAARRSGSASPRPKRNN